MQRQTYVVVPSGLVKSGSASYTADEVTGKITYEAEVTVGKWFVKKTYPFKGEYQADPKDLKSYNLQSVNKKIQIGDVIFTVVSIISGVADVSVDVEGQSMNGVAFIDTNGPMIRINSLQAKVTVVGMTLDLLLKETRVGRYEGRYRGPGLFTQWFRGAQAL